jgi:MFS-type transporter involved in bile tolerance (Atg22 family)
MQPDATSAKPASVAPDPAAQPLLSASSMRLLPWLIAVAFFMESLDTTILNTAVPTIASALHVAPLSMKSVLASYTLSLAVFIPISGWMADRFGTRRVFASAIGIFTLGSFLQDFNLGFNSTGMVLTVRYKSDHELGKISEDILAGELQEKLGASAISLVAQRVPQPRKLTSKAKRAPVPPGGPPGI